MKDRLIENWLTKANEKSFEVPFCQLLSGEGYEVIHISRHGSFEEGKDILAIDQSGTPCAFQLKGADGKKISQSEWSKYVGQINRLVEIPIKHPSIKSEDPRRVFFVTNGELEEEVRLEIEGRNQGWENRGLPKLETLVKGQLLTRFRKIHSNLWPTDLTLEKDLLEHYLSDGDGYVDKKKLANFLANLILFEDAKQTSQQLKRTLASTAIFTSYALSPFEERNNHVAIIEGWLIYLATLISAVEKFGIDKKHWKDSFEICEYAISTSFQNLFSELKSRDHLVEGNPLVDPAFYRGRVTWLLGLVSAGYLWLSQTDDKIREDRWFSEFVRNSYDYLYLWGEAALPQIFSVYWFLDLETDSIEPDRLLRNLIGNILEVNNKMDGLPDPYHGLAEVILDKFGLSSDVYPKENYKGRSYMLESLIQIFARKGWRGALTEFWPSITRIQMAELIPPSPWEFCLWYSENGIHKTTLPKRPKSWAELKKEAETIDSSYIPKILQQNPGLLLLFSITYPHRFTKDVVKVLDFSFNEPAKSVQ